MRVLGRFRVALLGILCVGATGCIPPGPLVLFPGGTCAAGTQIQFETFAYNAACLSQCPYSQGIQNPACVNQCWLPNHGGVLAKNACLRFPSLADVQGMRVRCVGSTSAGAWVSGLASGTASSSSCSVILN